MTTSPQPQRERQDLERLLDKLAKDWAAGLSTRQIGARLELSRGAVIGIVARARKHGDPRFRPRLKSSKQKAKPKVRVVKPAGENVGNTRPPPPPLEPLRPRLLVDLDWRDCRWPVGTAPDGRHLLCGRPAVPGRPYCERHCGAVRESTNPSASAPRASR